MDNNEKKKKAAIKSTKSAEKKKLANKLAKEAKKASDSALMSAAAELPAGGAKILLNAAVRTDKLNEQIAALNLAKRGIRAELKENKIELRVFDHVYKLRKMDPEDAKSFRATEALYTEQMGMELSPSQQIAIEDINKKREESRKAMLSVHGDDAGKEVGTGTEEDTDEDAPAIPAKNETIGLAAAPSSTH